MDIQESVLEAISKGTVDTMQICSTISHKHHCSGMSVIQALTRLRGKGEVDYCAEECRWSITRKPDSSKRRKKRV